MQIDVSFFSRPRRERDTLAIHHPYRKNFAGGRYDAPSPRLRSVARRKKIHRKLPEQLAERR
jgi:hypothetical protein